MGRPCALVRIGPRRRAPAAKWPAPAVAVFVTAFTAIGWSGLARAKPQVGVGGSALVGVTDNSAAVEEGSSGSSSDVFTGVRASAAVSWPGPKSRLTLAYDVAANLFFQREQRTSLMQVLALTGNLQPSPTTILHLTGRAEHGLMSDLDALVTGGGSPAPTTADPQGRAQPSGTFTILRLGGEQNLRWQLTPRLHLEQALRAYLFVPDDDDPLLGKSAAASFGLALFRTYRRHALGANLQADALRALAADDPLSPGDRWVTSARAMAVWDFRVSPLWATRLEAGAFTLWLPDKGEREVHPGGLATVRHDRPDATHFALTASRSARPNTLLGDMFITDRLQLLFTMPLGPDWRVGAEASAGREQGAFESVSGGLEYDVLVGTVGVIRRITDHIAISAHYSIRRQDTSSVAQTLAERFPSFTRNVVYVSVTFAAMPGQAQQEIPGPR